MKIKAERYDKNCYRLVDENSNIVGTALRLANNQWGLFDRDEKRISKIPFDKPSQVRDAMQRRLDAAEKANNETVE